MATTNLSTLYEHILVRHCTTGSINRALRLKAQEFFRRTSAWREDIAVTLTSGDTTAQLTLPAATGGTIGKLLYIQIDDGTDEAPKPLDAKLYSIDAADLVTFTSYQPATGDILTATVAILPDIATTAYRSDLIAQWGVPALVEGALAELYSQLDQPWGNEKLAGLHAGKYEDQVHKAARGTGRKTRSFFSMQPAQPIVSNQPGRPLMWSAGYSRK